jgi:hexokinase
VLSKGSYDGYIGIVAGTGCNTCCEIECGKIGKLGIPGSRKMLVNLESGSFCAFPRGDADLAMDEDLPDTGAYVAEKMISGRYLGQVCMYTLKMAAKEGLFSERATEIIEKMTEVTTPTIDKWGSARFPKGFNSEDRVNLVYIISEIFERSARCIASKICGILEVTGAGSSRPACIAVDGSLYSESKLLRPELERFMDVYAGEIMGRRYEFVNAENMSLIGTAAAVLMS